VNLNRVKFGWQMSYLKVHGKLNSALLLFVGNELALDIDVIIAPVTSQKPRNQFDIVLEYWEEAGLLKPSVVRTSKITSIHGTELKRFLGELHNHDLENVLNMCRKLF